MTAQISAQIALRAAVAAARNYADLITDRDPDDGEHVVPGELRRFLARLRLLHGVPFSYLVPDADLLPVESIRFFHLDRAWTDALVQGALSVGTISSTDRSQLEGVYPFVRQEVDEAERTIRQPEGEALLRGEAGTISGFLLRSRLVSGWPNLHVRAYATDALADTELTDVAESHPSRLKVLRLERLAPAVLLVLFDGVPEVVHIEEPRQGIQFGVRLDPDDPPAARRARVSLRDCANGNSVPQPDDLTAPDSVPVPFRPAAPGVINLGALKRRLAKAPNSGAELEPNEFALQMLRFPYRQVFGDPGNSEGMKFYPLDRFRATVALPEWKAAVETRLGRNGS